EEANRLEPAEGPWRQAGRSGDRGLQRNSRSFMSKRVFSMVCRRRYCRESCLKGRWSSWESSDPKAIGVEAICLRGLGAAGSEAPHAIVECRETGQSPGAFSCARPTSTER